LPIVQLALKDSVQRIKQKLSKQQDQKQAPGAAAASSTPTGEPDLLQTILNACRSLAASEADPAALARVVIAELVLPKIFHPEAVAQDGVKGHRVNHTEAKAFAFACGQIAGLIAGLSLQESTVDDALDEVCARAKVDAHRTLAILKKAGFASMPLAGTPSGVSPAEQSKQDATTSTLAMIDELERQAASTTDLAHAAALKVMASNMKRDLFNKVNSDDLKKDVA
jgi:hypothetical protein